MSSFVCLDFARKKHDEFDSFDPQKKLGRVAGQKAKEMKPLTWRPESAFQVLLMVQNKIRSYNVGPPNNS